MVETAHPAQALNCLFYFLQPKDVLPVTFVYKRQQNILLESVLKLNLNKRAFNARNETGIPWHLGTAYIPGAIMWIY